MNSDGRIADNFRECISKLSNREIAMLHFYLVESVLMTDSDYKQCSNMVAVKAVYGNQLAREAMTVRAKVCNYQCPDMRDI